MRDTIPTKFEIYVDTDVERLDLDTLQSILFYLRTDIGIPVGLGTMPQSRNRQQQMSLFTPVDSLTDEEDQD